MTGLKDYFFSLFERLAEDLQSSEDLLGNFLGERSDFVRFNAGRVRQAGEVQQYELALNLVSDQRSARTMTHVSGVIEADWEHCRRLLTALRAQIGSIPEDSHLLINREVQNSDSIGGIDLEPAEHAIEGILKDTSRFDSAGFYASGPIYRGFANSFGQRNWYVRASFNLEWSCFLENHKAVKSRYAGFRWEPREFEKRTRRIEQTLAFLRRPVQAIPPGRYRVFLAPAAVAELMATLSWLAFGAKNQRTRQSSLARLALGLETLNPAVSVIENNQAGLAPGFTRTGFIKPARIDLIRQGKHAGMLVNSRSAREYGLAVNADSEFPGSLEMGTGTLDDGDILKSLNHGLYIDNLWYTNYSDPNQCRITGMTRYACFQVEHGQITAPITPMRFDESLYRMLGSNLIAITRDREWILSGDTYLRRSVSSMRLPGLLIDDFNLTL